MQSPNEQHLEEKFEEWRDRYQLDKLRKWTEEDLRKEIPSFKNDVEFFLQRFNRGEKVTDERLSQTDEWSGEQPLTQRERQKIRSVEQEIIGNIKAAIGEKEREKTEHRLQLLDRVSEMTPDIILRLFR